MSDYLGIYKAVVVNNVDPLNQYRVQVQVPQVLGDAVSAWCEPVIPTQYTTPTGSVVYVQFLDGDLSQPVYASTAAVTAEMIVAGTITANLLAFTASTVYVQATAPTSPKTGDIWFNTSEGNLVEQWNGTQWVQLNIGTQALNFHPVNISYGTTAPTSPGVGDIWYNESSGNIVEQWNGTAWQQIPIGTGAIASGAITNTLIANNAIETPQLAANSVATGNLQAGSVTTSVLAANAVTTAILAADAVTAQNIAAGAVTTEKLTVVSNYQIVPNCGFDEVSQANPALAAYWVRGGEPSGAGGAATSSLDTSERHTTTGYALKISNTAHTSTYAYQQWSNVVPVPEGEWIGYSWWSVCDNTNSFVYSSTVAWSSTQAYNVGDIVSYNSDTYSCTTANTNQTPSGTSTYWHKILDTQQGMNVQAVFHATDSVMANGPQTAGAVVYNLLTGAVATANDTEQGFTALTDSGWTKTTARVQVPSGMNYMMLAWGTDGTDQGTYNVWFDDGQCYLMSSGDIQSSDFVPGTSGWALNDDGTSQVQSLNALGPIGAPTLNVGQIFQQSPSTITDNAGNVISNVDSNGNPLTPGITGDWGDFSLVTANDIYLGGTAAEGGTELATYIQDQIPVFAQAQATSKLWTSTVDSKNITSSNSPFMVCYINAGTVQNGHAYLVGYSAGLGGGTAGDNYSLQVRYTLDGTTPTTTSTLLPGSQSFVVWPSSGVGPLTIQNVNVFNSSSTATLKLGLAFTLNSGTGGGHISFSQTAYGTSIFVVDLGDQSPVTMSQVSKASGTDDGGNPGPSPNPSPPPTKKSVTYYPTWTQSYDAGGAQRVGDTTNHMYQGFYSSTHGNTKSAAGYNYSGIQSTLSGHTIDSLTLTFTVAHTYYNSGSTILIGTHNSSATSPPGTWPGGIFVQSKAGCVAGNQYTVTLPGSVATQFQNGGVKGIIFGPGTTTSLIYYAYMYGYGSGVAPSLKFTYT